MSVLDTSIANVALPTIGHELDATAEASVWVVNAYQIAIVMALLPVAALGEIVGYRRLFGIGLALFAAASFGCALAGDLAGLAAARFVQGFGAACVFGVTGALVRFTYPKAMLGRGIGLNALTIGIASAAGPGVAAAILSVASWRWLFAVNVPFSLLAVWLGFQFLPRAGGAARRFDYGSAALNGVAFGLLFLGFSSVAHGTTSYRVGVEFAAGLLAAAALIRRVRGQSNPLVPLDLLGIPILRLSYATSSCSFAATTLAVVALPFILQDRFGFGRVETGLLITALPLAIAAVAPISGRLVERVSAGLLGGIGLGVLAVGLCVLASLPTGVAPVLIVLGSAVSGIGFGLFQTPNNRLMLGVAPAERSGAAAGMLATARLVGQTAGAVIVALLFRLFGSASMAPLLLGAAVAALAAVLSLRRLSV